MDKLLVAVYLVLTVGGLTLVKLGSKGSAMLEIIDGKWTWHVGLLTILGLVCYGLSFALNMWLVTKFDLSVIVPITTALGQILILVVAVLLFNEYFTLAKIIAVALIVAGVVLLQWKTNS